MRPLILPILAVQFALVLSATAQAQQTEQVLAENGNLKAVAIVTNTANLSDSNWLVVEITNDGPEAVMRSGNLGVQTSGRSRQQLPLGIPVLLSPRPDSTGNRLPSGKSTIVDLGNFAAASLGIVLIDKEAKVTLTLNLTLADGRTLSTGSAGETFTITWSALDSDGIAKLRGRAETLLSKIENTGTLSAGEPEVMRLLVNSQISQVIPLAELLDAIRGAQFGKDSFQATSLGLVGLVSRRFPDDPTVIAFYREALASRSAAAMEDLSVSLGTAWDESLIEPILHAMESAVQTTASNRRPPYDNWLLVDRGLGLLDRHYASWSRDTSIPPRLSRVAQQVIPVEVNGFYNTVGHLVLTHDPAMIAVLRQSLKDTTIDNYTSMSQNMPLGVTPMRNCDLAANGILKLLGEPEMVSPWGRAKAPRGGPYPEWDDWDKKIQALQQRLDSQPPQ